MLDTISHLRHEAGELLDAARLLLVSRRVHGFVPVPDGMMRCHGVRLSP